MPPPLPVVLPPLPLSAAPAAPPAPLRVSLVGPAELRSAPGATAAAELVLTNNGDGTLVVLSAELRPPRPGLRLLPATPLPRVLLPGGVLALALQHCADAPCCADVVVEAAVEATNDRWWLPDAPKPQAALAAATVTLRCAA